MNSRLSILSMVIALAGCSGAETLVRALRSPQKVCPDGVVFYTSANRVPGKYREVALLSIPSVLSREEAKQASAMYRQHAGELGANAIVLNSRISPEAGAKVIGAAIGDPAQRRGMSVAIYLPSDTQRVNEVCQPSTASPAGGSADSSSRVVGPEEFTIASRPAPSPSNWSAFHRARARIRPFDLSGRPANPVVLSEPPGQPDSSVFIHNQDVRTALASMERLNFITDAEEVRPGLVRVSMGNVEPRAPMEFYMSFLHGSYMAGLPYGSDAIVELWAKGSKVGEYTKEGLVVNADSQ